MLKCKPVSECIGYTSLLSIIILMYLSLKSIFVAALVERMMLSSPSWIVSQASLPFQESNSPASEFISAESCSARLQLCSVFSQSHLIVSNFLSIHFNSLDAFHASTLSLLGLVLLRLLPIPIRQINSKQRCCILLVTRFQLVSSGLFGQTFVIWNSKSFNFGITLSTRFRRFSFPCRRRFQSTGCMASSQWLSTCTCKRLTVTLWLWP